MARQSPISDPPATHMLPSVRMLHGFLEAVNRCMKSFPRTNQIIFISILASAHTADEKECSSTYSDLKYRCKMIFTEIHCTLRVQFRLCLSLI